MIFRLNAALIGLWLGLLLVSVPTRATEAEADSTGLTVSSASGHLIVTYSVAGGPGADAGIKAGDGITAIGGVSTQGMPETEAQRLLLGTAGTVLVVTIRTPEGAEKKEAIVRRSILDTYLPAAKGGDPKAQARIANSYFSGQGLKQSDSDAFAWYYSAARQDDPDAEEHLGYLYRKGRGVAQNNRAAFAWCYRSAQSGSTSGEENLAYLYERGLGVTKNYGEALKWYTKAQLAHPESTSLKKTIALVSLRSFLEDRHSASKLDLSPLLAAFPKEIGYLFSILALVYAIGGGVLLYFQFRAGDAPSKLSVAVGWILFYMESQGLAFFGLCAFGATLSANVLLTVTALCSALPVVLSSAGPGRNRLWKPSPLSWKKLLFYGVACYLALALVSLGYQKLYILVMHTPLPAQPTISLLSKARQASPVLAFLTVALLLPMAEEIIFRGYLFETLQRHFSGPVTIILSAFAFSAIHCQLLYLLPLFGLGLVFGWLRLKTGSLRVPVLLHVTNNALALALVT